MVNYESSYVLSSNPSSIATRRDEVIERRQKVKGLSYERARTLQASLAWQQFRRDADEVRHMCVPVYSTHNIFVCITINRPIYYWF